LTGTPALAGFRSKDLTEVKDVVAALKRAAILNCFNGDTADLGTVTATETRYMRIKWEDGHESLSWSRLSEQNLRVDK
jgi:hypothetical protein